MNLTKGRKEPCKISVGGIKELYLMNYIEYDVRSIVGYRDLLISSFPTTQMFRYEGQGISFTETYSEEGFYNLELNFNLSKQDIDTSILLSVLINNKVRAVALDWVGNKKLIGTISGLDVEINANSGAVKGDFNGYSVKLTGQEEFKSPFVNDLEDTGFTDKNVDYSCLLASSSRPSSLMDKVSSCNIST